MASTRLPDKPMADISGKPMVVRVAERAALSGARDVIVATDHLEIANACERYGIEVCLTSREHASGTDRIAEVAALRHMKSDAVIVNVQGDEPLIDPKLIAAVAALVGPSTPMATAAHAIDRIEDLTNPNVVKVVLNVKGEALYFSRAPIPWRRDGIPAIGKRRGPEEEEEGAGEKSAEGEVFLPGYMPLRHIGLYAYRNDFLQNYPTLQISPLEQIEALEQLRVLWHGLPIAVHLAGTAPAGGVDTIDDLIRVREIFNLKGM